ncbi:MAG: hypothetical protein R2825_06970 [Saprospiraceae bacterium]
MFKQKHLSEMLAWGDFQPWRRRGLHPVITNCRFIDNHATTYEYTCTIKGGMEMPVRPSPIAFSLKNKALSAGAVYNLGAEQGQRQRPHYQLYFL